MPELPGHNSSVPLSKHLPHSSPPPLPSHSKPPLPAARSSAPCLLQAGAAPPHSQPQADQRVALAAAAAAAAHRRRSPRRRRLLALLRGEERLS